MQGQADVRRNVRDDAVPQRNRVQDAFAHVFLVIVRRDALFAGYVKVVELKHRHQVGRWRGAVDWSVVTVFVEERR